MRIVYDDAKADKAVAALHDFMTRRLDIKTVVREENWIMRVQRPELKRQIARIFAQDNLEIGDTVTHANGIGNNCRYPVYYKAGNELQQCCSININVDPFGTGYVSLEDYNGKRISRLYELTSHQVTVER